MKVYDDIPEFEDWVDSGIRALDSIPPDDLRVKSISELGMKLGLYGFYKEDIEDVDVVLLVFMWVFWTYSRAKVELDATLDHEEYLKRKRNNNQPIYRLVGDFNRITFRDIAKLLCNIISDFMTLNEQNKETVFNFIYKNQGTSRAFDILSGDFIKLFQLLETPKNDIPV